MNLHRLLLIPLLALASLQAMGQPTERAGLAEAASVALMETTMPGSDHLALSLSLDNRLTTSPLSVGTQGLNHLNMDLSYSWGWENRYLRLFSGLRYQMNDDNSLLSVSDLENDHRTLLGVHWKAGGFIGSVYSESSLPGNTGDFGDNRLAPRYNLEMGWDTGQFGKISIGARNLFNEQQPESRLESALNLPEAQGRVPYIRYQIDL